jgi:PleD family two-component response regulator
MISRLRSSVQMPVIDGYETAKLLRATDRTPVVPIIFITAGDRSEERSLRGHELGVIDFLLKSINTYLLKSKADGFVDLHRMTGELKRLSITVRERVADLEYVKSVAIG